MKADRNAIEQAYAFFHEHTAFLNDLRKAVSEMENGIGGLTNPPCSIPQKNRKDGVSASNRAAASLYPKFRTS